MKPIEILRLLPPWDKATPEDIVASPAWAIPCRMGETQCAIKMAEVAPVDTIDVSITLEGNQYVLSISNSRAESIGNCEGEVRRGA